VIQRNNPLHTAKTRMRGFVLSAITTATLVLLLGIA
jgi:hypothetical protein